MHEIYIFVIKYRIYVTVKYSSRIIILEKKTGRTLAMILTPSMRNGLDTNAQERREDKSRGVLHLDVGKTENESLDNGTKVLRRTRGGVLC